jgi:hypothetical protein
MSHEATIRDLDLEQSRLREKILRLEEERERVLNQSQATDEQHKHQVLSLEQVFNFSQFVRCAEYYISLLLVSQCLVDPDTGKTVGSFTDRKHLFGQHIWQKNIMYSTSQNLNLKSS